MLIIPGVNLRRARYFVAVADGLSYTKAAQGLHVAQSALSQQVKVLERELGVSLFERNGPRIALTPAGEIALEEARALLVQADRAVARIRAASNGVAGELNIAHTRSWAGGTIAQMVAQFRAKYEHVNLVEHRGFTSRNVELAVKGMVDVAVVRPPIHQSELTVRIVDHEPLLLAVPAGHRLAQLGSVQLREIENETVVFWPRENGSGMYDRIVALLWPNTAPNVVRYEADDEQVLLAVAAGVGIAPMPAGRAAAFRVPGVALCQVAGDPRTLQVGLAYRLDNPNPALKQFLDLVGESV